MNKILSIHSTFDLFYIICVIFVHKMHHRFACSTSLMCNFYCTICADLCVKVIESCIDKKIQNPVMFTVYAQIIIHELET